MCKYPKRGKAITFVNFYKRIPESASLKVQFENLLKKQKILPILFINFLLYFYKIWDIIQM